MMKLKKKKQKQLSSNAPEALSQASMDQMVYTDNSAQTG